MAGKNTEPKAPETIEEATILLDAEKSAHAETEKALQDEMTAHDKTKEESKGIIKDLKEKLKQKSSSSSEKKPTFKLDGKTYEVGISKANHKGEMITADNICENSKLQAELVKMGAGYIREKK